MSAPLTVPAVLRAAADLIEPEGKWTQEAFGKSDGGAVVYYPREAVCFCAMGAICAAAGVDRFGFGSDDTDNPVVMAIAEARLAVERIAGGLVEVFNDAPERTQAEVVAALRKAADLAEASEREAIGPSRRTDASPTSGSTSS